MREGDQFGSYLLEERLAVGGMAEIFRARRLGAAGFARRVCIKRILPQLCAEPSFVEMFIDEARTGAQLRHGNIVAIDDFGEVAGQYFLCMELVSGTDLARLLRTLAHDGKACPTEVALFVATEVLKALDYAHRKVGADGRPLGIVHRDVTPHNVLVSFAGEVKLSDFGIAKAASRVHQTAGHVVKGKLAYMAPEQIYGRPLDGRCDLFALGVVLFEALAGRRPFVGANDAAVVHAILKNERPALRALRPDVPEGVAAFVDGLLAPEPAQRFASAGAALAAAVELPALVTGARMLAGMLGHYYPGQASSVRGEGFFTPAMLPAAVTPAGQSQLLAEARNDTDRVDAATAPTELSDVLEAVRASSSDSHATTAPTIAAGGGGGLTAASGPPAFDPEVMGAAIPATMPASTTATFVLPVDAPAPDASREVSPHDATRTMMAPGAQLARVTSRPGATSSSAAVEERERDASTAAAPASPSSSSSSSSSSRRAPAARTNHALALLGGGALLAAAVGTGYLLLAARPHTPDTPASTGASVAATTSPDDPPRPAPVAARDAGHAAGRSAAPDAASLAGGSAADAAMLAPSNAPAANARDAPAVDPDAGAPSEGAQPTADATPDAAAASERGTLLVQAVPWALVSIDGRARGQTPVHARLAAGHHSVELSFPPDHALRHRSVTLAPGGRAQLTERFAR